MNFGDTGTSEPSVPRQELLEYLLDRCDEAHHRLRLGLPFQVLGYSAIYHDKSLLREYHEAHLPLYSPFDRLRAYQRLFREALSRLMNSPVEEVECPTLLDYPQAVRPSICRKFLVTAVRDGTEMLDTHDYRFLSVFLLTSWLGLRLNNDAAVDFERLCLSSNAEPHDRIGTALPILKEALRPKTEKSS